MAAHANRRAGSVLWAALALSGAALAQQEAPVDTQAVDPPRYYKPDALIEFPLGPTAKHRYFIDAASVTVSQAGEVREVRYTLVVRTRGGATNVSYEGMRCGDRQRILYAVGREPGVWSHARNQQWTALSRGGANEPQAELAREYFCPDGVTVRDAKLAVDGLRRGPGSLVSR